MVEKGALVIDLSPEERQQLEALASQRGYQTVTEYVRGLIQSDTEALYEQAYFWSEGWQAGERAADEDMAAGRVETFDTMDDFLADLMDDDE